MPNGRLVKKFCYAQLMMYGREEDLGRNGRTTWLSGPIWPCVKLWITIESHGGRLYLASTVANQGTKKEEKVKI